MKLKGLLLALLFIASACSPDIESNLPGIVENPNRRSPGAYTQSEVGIPGGLDDPWFVAAGPFTDSTSFLWGFQQLGAFATFGELSLPAREIIVAVIDTGVDKDHEDLAGRLWVNPVEGLGDNYRNGLDDDGNGYVDDYLGWDYVNNTNNPADDSGHGTHVAGTIAAAGNNGRGIVGVAPWVRIMALKVCNSSGECTSPDIRAAMAYAVANGAKVINISLGGYDPGSADTEAFNEAITAATDAGTLVVVSAGNSLIDVSEMSPANAVDSVAVGAHRNDGVVCGFSNFGWKLDLSGPGCGLRNSLEVAGVLSLDSKKCGPAGDRYCATRNIVAPGYVLKSGTSMAAPHVSGLAAVAFTASPDATALQIRQAVVSASGSGRKEFALGKGLASAVGLATEAREAPGLKIRAPRHGTGGATHEIDFRVEARNTPVTWQLGYLAEPGFSHVDLTLATPFAGAGGTIEAGAAENLNSTVTLPGAGDYLVVLRVTSAGRQYYDTVFVQN